ncbi:hypothetical protein DRW41_14215 [Neobacillus piezotolerans]|uniref:Uncharacterized protein n=1 Tax=Neobacillus piezotolerans TaxID=2259171 RepID=A0A3D8GPG5_9BACI|nr:MULTISPECIES: hypothetical protein [Bacillaceae]RDU36182.1 hypothetical protein DRW41_14215 [Neobacillus piezotolerans]
MKKWVWNLIFLILFALVTFFGVGPLLLADGVWIERVLPAIIVLAVYIYLSYLYRKIVLDKKKPRS